MTREKSCGASTTQTRGGTAVIVATASPQNEVSGVSQQRMVRSMAPTKPAQSARSSQPQQARNPAAGSMGYPQTGLQRACDVQPGSPLRGDEMSANPHCTNTPSSVGGSVTCLRKQQGSIFFPGKQA